MMKPIYILSSSAISPQLSFEPEQFLNPVKESADGKLFVTDIDYRQFINPVAIRRMSRQLKMGIAAGMQALKLAGVEQPDAIITGTGLGSMTDMEHFLKDMISMNEEALNPTYFIQSTYNSVNGWLALQSKGTGYNQTFVNRGLSFELAALDAQLFLNEASEKKVALTGCFDELTPEYYIVKDKIGYWKKDPPLNTRLLEHSDSPGTIAGEGAAFFTFSNDSNGAVCVFKGLKMIQEANVNMQQEIAAFLQLHQLAPKDVDLVIAGMNGDRAFQSFYDDALAYWSDHTAIAIFKPFTGEYPTASGFAAWLATQILASGNIPESAIFRKGTADRLQHILILNHYILNTASLMLLSAL